MVIQLVNDGDNELSEIFDIDITAASGGVNVRSTDVYYHVAIEDDDNPLYSDGTGTSAIRVLWASNPARRVFRKAQEA